MSNKEFEEALQRSVTSKKEIKVWKKERFRKAEDEAASLANFIRYYFSDLDNSKFNVQIGIVKKAIRYLDEKNVLITIDFSAKKEFLWIFSTMEKKAILSVEVFAPSVNTIQYSLEKYSPVVKPEWGRGETIGSYLSRDELIEDIRKNLLNSI